MNAIPTFIDVSNLRLSNDDEDWDKETPLVREVSYDDYFKRAYPEAEHRIVDCKRIHYPISGTKIRNMKNKKEREQWTI